MLIEKSYTINAEHLQHLIMDDLFFMLSYYHDLLKPLPQREKDFYYLHYRKNRALLRRMLMLQGLKGDELDMVLGYLRDLEDVVVTGKYKMR